MAKSQLTGSQIKDGTITRDDINVTTTGKSVVAKLIDGSNGIKIDTYSGADTGTGDVSLKVDLPYLDTKYPSLLSSKSQNLFFASPAVGSGTPIFRALTTGDIPSLNYLSYTGATSNININTKNFETSGRLTTGNLINNIASKSISGTGIIDITMPNLNLMGVFYIDVFTYGALVGTFVCQFYTYYGSSINYAGSNSVAFLGKNSNGLSVRYVTIGTDNNAERHIYIGGLTTNWGNWTEISIRGLLNVNREAIKTNPPSINLITEEPSQFNTTYTFADFSVESASKLGYARNINGTAFNGTADITTNLWGTARNFTLGNSTKVVNGSANMSWSLAEIGAASTSHTHSFSEITNKPTTLAGYGITDAFGQNSIKSQNVNTGQVTTLDTFLPNGGFITGYGTPTWGGTDTPVGSSYGGYIKFSNQGDVNNLELYYNNGHNSTTTHRLWFRTKNSSNGTTNWFEVATRDWAITQFPTLNSAMFEDNTRPSASVDLNTYKTQGFYAMGVITNGPVGAGNYGNLLVTQSAGDRFMQLYFDQSGNNVYFRNGIGGTTVWGTWKLTADRDWVTSQLASYVTQSSLNTQFGSYATLAGTQTFSNTITFNQSPIVPNATLLPHAVNFGQMSNAIEESEGNTVGYVSNNYVNTPDGFAVLLNNGTDLNANLKTGFYRGEQLVNAPNNNVGWWFITVETHDNTWVTQKAISFGAANVGGLIYQRNLSWDGWSDWEQVWTSKQFSQTNINKWDAAIEKNVVFSTDSTLALMISDGSFNGEAGLVDSDNEVIIAGEENGYWKFATNIGDTGGILVDKNTRRMSYGNVLPSGSYKHNFGGTIFINDNITSAGGFIHNDYNDPNKILTSDGGVIDINSFGGTTVKYTEVNSGDSFTPSPDYIHHNVLARGGMKLYLDTGSGSVNGQVINLFHNISSITQVWKDGAVVATISGAKTTKFIKTSVGWQMTDLGSSNFI